MWSEIDRLTPARHRPLGDVAKQSCSSAVLWKNSCTPPPPPPPPPPTSSSAVGVVRQDQDEPSDVNLLLSPLTLCLRRWNHFAPPAFHREVPFAKGAPERGSGCSICPLVSRYKTSIDTMRARQSALKWQIIGCFAKNNRTLNASTYIIKEKKCPVYLTSWLGCLQGRNYLSVLIRFQNYVLSMTIQFMTIRNNYDIIQSQILRIRMRFYFY